MIKGAVTMVDLLMGEVMRAIPVLLLRVGLGPELPMDIIRKRKSTKKTRSTTGVTVEARALLVALRRLIRIRWVWLVTDVCWDMDWMGNYHDCFDYRDSLVILCSMIMSLRQCNDVCNSQLASLTVGFVSTYYVL